MSSIINKGENLALEKQVSIAQTKTQAGKRVAQKRGPTLYNLSVDVPVMKIGPDCAATDDYYSIEEEIMSLEYGSKTLQGAGISGTIGGTFTTQRGSWGGTPVVNGASQTGTSLIIDGATIGTTNYVRAFDYVQFEGSTKVYQIVNNENSDAGGNLVLDLNTPLVTSPGDGSTITFGNNVSFNFALIVVPTSRYMPGDIIQYGTFEFQEVIELGNRNA